MEKIKFGPQDTEINRKRYRLPAVTLMIDKGELGPLIYRPNPLINVELDVGWFPITLASVWYLN
jgi:hypothetical protein